MLSGVAPCVFVLRARGLLSDPLNLAEAGDDPREGGYPHMGLLECHEKRSHRWQAPRVDFDGATKAAPAMLYAGLDLSRKRLDVCLLDEHGEKVVVTAAPPDSDGLRGLVARLATHGTPVRAAIESMNGARFIHDTMGYEFSITPRSRTRGSVHREDLAAGCLARCQPSPLARDCREP